MNKPMDKVTVPGLRAMKEAGTRIAILTAYDASFAAMLDAANLDCVLVGDSLGNVIQGRDSTLPVTLEDMVYHTVAVRRGVKRALLIADMPFLSYHDRASAVDAAGRLMRSGAEMVKLEGGRTVLDQVKALTELGIPVCAHLGLTPQSVHRLGGYRVQGRESDAARRILEDARALEQAGVDLLVLECVPEPLAAEVTAALSVPVIGIGAGIRVDGQVLVLYDALGIGVGPRPRFVRNFTEGGADVAAALAAYVKAVRDGSYPGPEQSYK